MGYLGRKFLVSPRAQYVTHSTYVKEHSLFTSAKCSMLQDMRHASSIWRICLEPDTEDIVLVFSSHVDVVGIGFVVLQADCCKVQFWNVLLLLNSKPMDPLTDLRKALKACDSRSRSSYLAPAE